jgi:hypothetical protein
LFSGVATARRFAAERFVLDARLGAGFFFAD